jgi:hypothetical protein
MTRGRKIGRKQVRRRYGGFSGRPSELDPSGNEARSTSCFSRNSKGWLPEMKSLQQARLAVMHWGRLGMEDPANVSGDAAGFNVDMWQGYENVGDALRFLGYEGTDGIAMLRAFQSDWNRVVSRVAIHPRFQAIVWKRIPRGNLVVDGEVGPRSLNALEVAILNSDLVPWSQIVSEAKDPDALRLGRKRIYNAKERV